MSTVSPGPGAVSAVVTAGTAVTRAASGPLNRLKAEPEEEAGPEGAQVEVPVVLVRFADESSLLPTGIVQASQEGPAVAEL